MCIIRISIKYFKKKFNFSYPDDGKTEKQISTKLKQKISFDIYNVYFQFEIEMT